MYKTHATINHNNNGIIKYLFTLFPINIIIKNVNKILNINIINDMM